MWHSWNVHGGLRIHSYPHVNTIFLWDISPLKRRGSCIKIMQPATNPHTDRETQSETHRLQETQTPQTHTHPHSLTHTNPHPHTQTHTHTHRHTHTHTHTGSHSQTPSSFSQVGWCDWRLTECEWQFYWIASTLRLRLRWSMKQLLLLLN